MRRTFDYLIIESNAEMQKPEADDKPLPIWQSRALTSTTSVTFVIFYTLLSRYSPQMNLKAIIPSGQSV